MINNKLIFRQKMHFMQEIDLKFSCVIRHSSGTTFNVLDLLPLEPGAFYIMDRAYLDFSRLYHMNGTGAFFVNRTKSNTKFDRRYSHPVDRETGVICDQTIVCPSLLDRRAFCQYVQRHRRVPPHLSHARPG